MVPWDTLGVDRGPICQGPTDLFSPPHFLGSLKGPETPPGGRLLGEFNFYWLSLQPPVFQVSLSSVSINQLPYNFAEGKDIANQWLNGEAEIRRRRV